MGTTLYQITFAPSKVTVEKETTTTLSISNINNTFIYGSLTDTSLYTTTDNVLNAVADTIITVPFVKVSGIQDNAGAIKAKFTFDPTKMTFTGIEGTDFTAEAITSNGSQTGEIRLYKDYTTVNPSGANYATPYELKLKFKLNSRPTNNTNTTLTVTEFKVYPFINGTISDTVYSELKDTGYTKTINFIDRAEMLTNYLSDTANGSKITTAVEEDGKILYTVKTANAPLDFTNYSYTWYTNKGDDNYTTAITDVTGSNYDPARAYIGYRLKAKVTATSSSRTLMNADPEITSSIMSDSVLIQPKLSPSIAFGDLIHTNGFATGKTIGYLPNFTYNYTDLNSTKEVTYQWSYCDTENGTYSTISNTTNNLTIDALYIKKWLKLTTTTTETVGECTKTTTDSVKYFLGAPNVNKPTITTVTITNNDDTAITDSARARDTQAIKAAVVGTDVDQILTSYSYQWYRAGVVIEGATSQAYSLTKADVGSEITVKAIALSDYFTQGESNNKTSGAITAYANLTNAPAFSVGTITVTDNKYVVGNVIDIPFTATKYYDLITNNSELTKFAFSANAGIDKTAAVVDIDSATALELTATSAKYTITAEDMNKRYIVFKLMARENTIAENITVGSTVVVIDTYTGEAINWAYTLDYEVTDNANFNGYKAWSIVTNIGKNNTLSIAVNPTVVTDTNAKIFYSSERGKYVVLMPNGVTPDMDKFTFNMGTTPTIFYGKQTNTIESLDVVDVMKPINVWLKKDVNATNENMLISEVSGNGAQDSIDTAQLIQAILNGTTTDKKDGNLGILSK